MTAREEFRGQGVEVLGVAVDRPDAVESYLQQSPISYPVLVDYVVASELLVNLGNEGGGLPFTVAVDREGRVVDRHLGAADAEAIRKLIQRIL